MTRYAPSLLLVSSDASEDVDPAGTFNSADRRARIENANRSAVGQTIDMNPPALLPTAGEDIVAGGRDAGCLSPGAEVKLTASRLPAR